MQSVFFLHALAQVFAQTPSQQSWPVALQSDEVMHDFGHGSVCGFRHSPFTFKLGSTVFTDVQQTSPAVVSHSELVVQPFGHRLAGVHSGLS